MSSEVFASALTAFTMKPAAATAFTLIKSCQDFIYQQALRWREPALSLGDKMREIMSEMLLILLEDFDPGKVSHPNSVFAYLQAKIMRLTRPYRKKSIIFVENCDLLDSGRCNFSAGRLQLAEEIFGILRRFLLGHSDPAVARLEFMFVHIYPEIRWISRLLAQKNGIDENTQIEADKKRHQAFNRNLRDAFNRLQNGELTEILNWSSGERSHLAWRIINIAPAEIDSALEPERQLLADWRENIDRRQPQPLHNLDLAGKILNSMQNIRKDLKKGFIAAEEAVPYGEEPDILLQLIGRRPDTDSVAEETDEWPEISINKADKAADKLFEQVADEVSNWLDTLVINKNPAEIKAKTGYNHNNIYSQRH
ncbi:MAG: hypothetical protein ACD_39C01063G0002 [uncultured bacterium]|nr:MAG: hypothetical protein ACD_39C01063G0002 [uncultured bacterium]